MKNTKMKCYFFPMKFNYAEGNSYTMHIVTALSEKYEMFNIDEAHKKINMLRQLLIGLVHYRRADIFILNWTEFLVEGKNIIGFPFYVLMTCLYKLRGKKIVYFLHEKFSGHNLKNKFLKLLIMRYNAWIANFTVTYAEEGIAFFRKNLSKKAKIYAFPHPAYPEATPVNIDEKYDIVVWGMIKPYKRVLDFLRFYEQNPALSQKKLLICGYCPDKKYDDEIRSHITPNVTYLNDFLPVEKLNEYLSASKNILFTYDTETVLCSGALIYSISFGKNIIGTHNGAFIDCAKWGMGVTYNSFDEISSLLVDNNRDNSLVIKQFMVENTWKNLAEKIDKLIKQ